MPYPSRIDRDAILTVTRDLVAEHGAADVSLHRVARELGVKAPSLYRYVRNKEALLQAINEDTQRRLFTAIYDALDQHPDSPPVKRLLLGAHAQRQFAHENTQLYRLLFETSQPESQTNPEIATAGVLRLQSIVAGITGEATSLTALRGLLAIIHGFITLELGGQFRRGGDLSDAFTDAIQLYIQGLVVSST